MQIGANWQYIETVSNLLMRLQCDALEATLQRVSAASTAPGDDKSSDGNTHKKSFDER